MKAPLIVDLKKHAHELINSLVETGLTRKRVYLGLRKRLKCVMGKEHFARMQTVGEVQRAIDKLEHWLKSRRQSIENKNKPEQAKTGRRAEIRANTLPNALQRLAIAELKRQRDIRGMPWWKRWWYRI